MFGQDLKLDSNLSPKNEDLERQWDSLHAWLNWCIKDKNKNFHKVSCFTLKDVFGKRALSNHTWQVTGQTTWLSPSITANTDQ